MCRATLITGLLLAGCLVSEAAAVIARHHVLQAALDLGRPPGELRALGTGGLVPLSLEPGSYAFLAVADPQTRNGVVGGWLTHDRGSGVVFAAVDGGKVRLQARI